MSETPRATVLLVDDDREIVGMSGLLLESAGFRVVSASSGEEGLLRVRAERPDVVLLDINMPGIDGWEVLRVLREDPESATVPVIMFSVNFEVAEKLRALQFGASDYLVKPFDVDVLVAKIEGQLSRGVGEGWR